MPKKVNRPIKRTKVASSTAGVLKKVTAERATERIVETLKSITESVHAGSLRHSPKTHPINRLVEDVDPDTLFLADPLSLATILVNRLEMQGYVLFFDEKLASKTLDEGRARLKALLPE